MTADPGVPGQKVLQSRGRHVGACLTARVTDDLAARVYAASHLTGRFELRSGQVSTEYFDKYLFETDPALLRSVAEAMVPLLPAECDMLAGMELGGIPIATVMSQLTGLPTLFVRKEAKTHGTCKLAEGGAFDGKTLVIIEDVITTAGAVLLSAAEIRAGGGVVESVVCAIDREQGGRANLEAAGLELRAALSRTQLDAAA